MTLYGKAARRAPTAFFSVAGLAPRAVAEHLAARGVNVWDGDNYAYELCTALGLEPDGAVRAGLVHYNDASDVDRLPRGHRPTSPADPAQPAVARQPGEPVAAAGASP